MKIQSALFSEWYPFDKFYPQAELITLGIGDIPDPDGFLVIWGGGDIHPSLYGRPNIASSVGKIPSLRDQAEATLFKRAVDLGVPIVGICRGAQLGCALSGGVLVQHVEGHERSHGITTINGQTLISSSLHHQMMGLWGTNHELFAWSSEKLSDFYLGITDEELDLLAGIEPEIVWFPDTKCLAIQGHPEFLDLNHPFNTLTKELLLKYGIYKN